MRTFLLTAAFMCAPLIPAVLARSAPEPRGAVAVVVNPFRAEGALGAVAAAEGRIVRLGRWPFIAVAETDGPDSEDGPFRDRLRAAGAWLLLDPLGLGACLEPRGAAS
jgi:hypothetical protein